MFRLETEQLEKWTDLAQRVRKEIVSNVHDAQGGHIGGSLSVVELLIALYFKIMRIDPQNPDWEDRDRFILSKGHASIGLYTVLAERGFFQTQELCSFDVCGSRMQAHPCMLVTPGIDMSTGSLGQGLSAGAGIALGAKLFKKNFLTYVMIGDGEAQEGQIWEAIMMASHYRLDNLITIMDYNKVQLYGHQKPTPTPPLTDAKAKFEAFGWHTLEIDGHNYQAILDACQEAKETKGVPTMIIADTIKGKGVSFMEGRYEWHAKVPSDEECQMALKELDCLPRKCPPGELVKEVLSND
ncbi:MAG: transketolase [Desulfobacterales bacterium]|nr:MAG: transketolase [Desulfobacterales bacterium]